MIMKPIMNAIPKGATLLLAFLCSLAALAQDKKLDVDVDVNKGGGDWYAQPWVWIVGGAIFILLLVALLRGNSSRD